MSESAPLAGSDPLICLDTTPIIHFNRVGELELLKALLPDAVTPTYVMNHEINDWEAKYPDNVRIREGGWPPTLAADTEEDARLIAELSRLFPQGGRANIGELHVIAITKRHNGTSIVEDQQARNAARSVKVKSNYMVSLIAAASASGFLTENEAYKLHKSLEVGRERSVIRSDESQKFRDVVRFMKELQPGWKPWPSCLHKKSLDQIAISSAYGQLDQLRERNNLPKR